MVRNKQAIKAVTEMRSTPQAATIQILPEDEQYGELYLNNLKALAQRDIALARAIAKAPLTMDSISFPGLSFDMVESRTGLPVFTAEWQGRISTLQSKYDPAAEAVDLLAEAWNDKNNTYVVLGLGMGYHLDALFDRLHEWDRVFILEPHPEIFKQLLRVRDMTRIFEHEGVVIDVGTNPQVAAAKWEQAFDITFVTGMGFIELMGYRRLPSAAYIENFRDNVKGMLMTRSGNIQTLMVHKYEYQANTLKSIDHIFEAPGIRTLFNKFEGMPGIIISAGPSLDKNVDMLKDLKDKALLIGVDTSLKPLLKRGIEPHLVCTGDPQYANYRHLKDAEVKDSYIVAEPMTHIKSLDDFSDRLFIASFGDQVMKWIGDKTQDVGTVMCWGSVATMAFDTARKLGCDPIIFIGQDLSYPGGKTYCEGTYFKDEDKKKNDIDELKAQGRHLVEVTDIHGETVTTNRQMYAYHRWFVNQIQHTKDRTVVNATEGGILKEGVEIMTLKEAAEKFLTEKLPIDEIIAGAREEKPRIRLKHFLKDVDAVCRGLNRIKKKCQKGMNRAAELLKSSTELTDDPETWGGGVKELEKIRCTVSAESIAVPFINMGSQAPLYRFIRFQKLMKTREKNLEMYQEALHVYFNLFLGVGDVANNLFAYFDNAYKMLESSSENLKKSA